METVLCSFRCVPGSALVRLTFSATFSSTQRTPEKRNDFHVKPEKHRDLPVVAIAVAKTRNTAWKHCILLFEHQQSQRVTNNKTDHSHCECHTVTSLPSSSLIHTQNMVLCPIRNSVVTSS
ncbi:hypothetical protein BaRGS_00012176 [Batillaria attramentaria]|uniref:Secreted protein n=1 Tax=Batillaria attramentaria TaxID=370345 RepID=A0ABD0LBJ9_9CAEN